MGVTFDVTSLWEVAVMPMPGSPEYRLLADKVNGRPKIFEENPLRALLLAIAYPLRSFSSLRVGIDPGRRSCGVAALADGLLFHASSIDCSEVGREASSIIKAVPSGSSSVFLGSGTGWEEAADALLEAGVEFKVVDEYGTSKGDLGLPLPLKDKNMRAAVRLALSPPGD